MTKRKYPYGNYKIEKHESFWGRGEAWRINMMWYETETSFNLMFANKSRATNGESAKSAQAGILVNAKNEICRYMKFRS